MPKPRLAFAALFRAILVGLAAVLAGCAEHAPVPSDPVGRLFARGLDEVSELYITPISTRKLAFAGTDHLSQLDRKIAVTESAGSERGGQIVLAYGGREVAAYP